MRWLLAILNWLFPLSCVGCEKIGFTLCTSCKEALELKTAQECPYCRVKNYNGDRCVNCRANGCGQLDGLITLFNYEKGGVIAKLLHHYKYDQLEDYGLKLIALFRENAEQYRPWLSSFNPVITWIPMTLKKRRARGFNQSEVLARGLEWGEPKCLVEKVRESRAQMSLNRKDRLINLNNAFKLTTEWGEIAGRKIIIVDDIATTMATLEEVAMVLKAAGAKQIYGLTVARQKA